MKNQQKPYNTSLQKKPLPIRGKKNTNIYITDNTLDVFNEIFEHTPVGLCLIDRSGAILRANATCDALLGNGKATFGSQFAGLLPPDCQSAFEAAVNNITANKKAAVELGIELLRQGGHMINLQLLFSQLSGNVLVTVKNTTDSQKVKRLLYETQKTVNIGGWEYDLLSNEINWTREVYDIFDLDPSAYHPSSSNGFRYYHPDSLPTANEALHRATEHGEPFDLEFKLNTAKERVKWVRATCKPLRVGNKIVKLYGAFQDITHIKAEQDRIKASELWFKSIFNVSRDGMLIELNGSINLVNQALITLFKYEQPSDLIGKPINTVLISENNQLPVIDWLGIAAKSQSKPSLEIKGHCENGKLIDIEIAVSPLEVDSQQYRIITVRDITERKLAEKKLKEQNGKLIKANAELDRFVYSASHDLRAPMLSLLGLINLIKLSLGGAEVPVYLGLMEESIKKLDNFLQDIVDYSRNARVSIAHEAIDFERLMEKVYEHLDLTKKNDEGVEKLLNVETSEAVYSDFERLKIILCNLISNSIRYKSNRNRHPYVSVTVHTNGNGETVIQVKDNGQGIDSDHIDKIFDMFYRGAQLNLGSGLGLYIVKETVTALSGTVTVRSITGMGSTFTITLPNTAPGQQA